MLRRRGLQLCFCYTEAKVELQVKFGGKSVERKNERQGKVISWGGKNSDHGLNDRNFAFFFSSFYNNVLITLGGMKLFLSDAPHPYLSAEVLKLPICCMYIHTLTQKNHTVFTITKLLMARIKLQNCSHSPDISKGREKKVWLTSFHKVCWLLAWLRASMIESDKSSRWPSAAGRNTRALRTGEELQLHPVAVILGVYQRGGNRIQSGIVELLTRLR